MDGVSEVMASWRILRTTSCISGTTSFLNRMACNGIDWLLLRLMFGKQEYKPMLCVIGMRYYHNQIFISFTINGESLETLKDLNTIHKTAIKLTPLKKLIFIDKITNKEILPVKHLIRNLVLKIPMSSILEGTVSYECGPNIQFKG